MQQDKIDMWIVNNAKFLPEDKIVAIKEKLQFADDSKFTLISTVEFKDPTLYLIISIFLGELGIDRFLLGEIGMGVLKLLTGGCCGILWLIDLFTIQKKTREANYNKLMMVL